MTEPDREEIDAGAEGIGGEPRDAGPLKETGEVADDPVVLDGIGGGPRLTWNPVTDTGGAPPDVGETAEKSSFQFDLGGALARLGDDEPAPAGSDGQRPGSRPESPPEVSDRPIQQDVETPEASVPDAPAGHVPSPRPPLAQPEPLPTRSTPVAGGPTPFVDHTEPTDASPSGGVFDSDPAPAQPGAVFGSDPSSSPPSSPSSPPLPSAPSSEVVSHADPLPSQPGDVFESGSLPTSSSSPLPSAPSSDVVSHADPLPSQPGGVFESDPLPTRGGVVDDTSSRPELHVAPTEPVPAPVDPSVGAPAPVDPSVGIPTPAQEFGAAPTGYPRRVPGTHLESQMRDAQQGIPVINEATPVDASPRPAARHSVFDDVGSDGNSIPGAASIAGAPTLPGGPNPGPTAVPSLPASNPVAPPPLADAMGAGPTTPDITALRSAQIRADKQQRQGKMFGRSLLAFVLIGGVIAAALVFGRSLLFDTSWDAQLTPIVNEVEAARGAEFSETVPLEVVPAAEMGDLLRAATIGDGWVADVPQWRALGLATGSVTAESVGTALASSTVAIYNADEDRIYLAEGTEPGAANADLRVALERAFDDQNGTAPPEQAADSETSAGFVGVSALQSISARAVDGALASGGTITDRRPADEALPLPIAYELAAIEVLGEPILASAGVTATDLVLGEPYPETVLTALDDAPGTAASAIIQPGEVSIAPPVALGNDDWSLVWGVRLPETTVDRLVDQVAADSYRPVDRNGTVCVVAVFQTATDAAGADVFASMLSWAAGAPAASQAVVSQLGPMRVQLDVCDPGAEGGAQPNIGVVDALIDRQQLRLTN